MSRGWFRTSPDAQGFAVETYVREGLPSFYIVGASASRTELIRSRVAEMLAANGESLPARLIVAEVCGPWRPNIAIAQGIYDGLRAIAGEVTS